jgi:hypothetical protein
MTKINKIVTSEIEGRNTSDRYEANSYSYGPDGTINYHDADSLGKPFVGPGVVYGANYDSGDKAGRNTIKLIPDSDLLNNSYSSDQYVVVDPTAPNHIHLRAGGTQDASSADIFLGAEYTNVQVSDGYKSVYVRSKQQGQSMAHLNINTETSEYLITTDQVSASNGWTVEANSGTYYIQDIQVNTPIEGQTTIWAPGAGFQPNGVYNVFSPVSVNQWDFNTNGTFYGPAEDGQLEIAGIRGENGHPTMFIGPDSIVLDGNNGEFLDDPNVPGNQIATIEDISNAVPATQIYNPVWSGTGLTFTGSPTTGHYIKNGDLVQVSISVVCTTVTNFGTGNYSITIPFAPLNAPLIRGTITIGANIYDLVGIAAAGSTTVNMSYWGGNQVSVATGIDHNSPDTLTTDSKFDLYGSYIAQPLT